MLLTHAGVKTLTTNQYDSTINPELQVQQMADNRKRQIGKVDTLPEVTQPTVVSDELGRIYNLLRDAFPEVHHISFEFDGKLMVHMDSRRKEQVALIQERLPFLAGGRLFSGIRRGETPKRPFDHRISALVAR